LYQQKIQAVLENDKNIGSSDNYIISQTLGHNLSQFELDTVRIKVDRCEVTEEYRNYLINLTNSIEKRKNVYEGRYKNFYISFNDFHITLIGSFSNYFVGIDQLLPFDELPKAVSQLSYELGLDLKNARIYRADINFNIFDDLYINNILKYLFVDLSRFKRLEQDYDGVRFQTETNSLALCFYLKTKELIKKGKINPRLWYRIEYRINRDVKRRLGIKYVKDLYDPNNYINLIELLINRYFQVQKQKTSKDLFDNTDSKMKYEDYVFLKGLESIGGLEQSNRDIQQLDKSGYFKYPKKKTRLRSKIKSIAQNNINTATHPVIKNLYDSILGAYEIELYKLELLPKSKTD
jgi:hypothetical protein